MTTYVYAPLPDVAFDAFLPALVIAKNAQHGAGSYVHIDRNDPAGLSVIRAGDRLYIGIHGSVTGRVYTATPGGIPIQVMSGLALADFLVAAGLPKVRMRLYLWVCWSAAEPGNSPNGAWGSLGSNVVTQVASRLKRHGHSRVTVIGYRHEVSIVDVTTPGVGIGIMQDPQKKLWLPAHDDHPRAQGPTAGHRVYKRSGWQRAQ